MWVGLSQPPSTLPDGGGNSNIFGISPLFGEDGPILTHFSDGCWNPPRFSDLVKPFGPFFDQKGGWVPLEFHKLELIDELKGNGKHDIYFASPLLKKGWGLTGETHKVGANRCMNLRIW